jgi:hypothetical protein
MVTVCLLSRFAFCSDLRGEVFPAILGFDFLYSFLRFCLYKTLRVAILDLRHVFCFISSFFFFFLEQITNRCRGIIRHVEELSLMVGTTKGIAFGIECACNEDGKARKSLSS